MNSDHFENDNLILSALTFILLLEVLFPFIFLHKDYKQFFNEKFKARDQTNNLQDKS